MARESIRELTRKMVANGLYRTGLFPMTERLLGSRGQFGILCYHRVGTEGVPLFSRLQPALFRAQIQYLKKSYRIVSLGQLCDEMQSGAPTSPTLAITFDDGYRDLYSYAFPVLQEFQVPATIYLIGRCMESGDAPWYDRIFLALKAVRATSVEVDLEGPKRFELSSEMTRNEAAWKIVSFLRTKPDRFRRAWCAQFEKQFPFRAEDAENCMLTWQQVRSMHHAGVNFGAHTMSHPCVRQLEPEELQTELRESKRLLENGLGAAMEDFAFPFGKPEDRSAAAEACLRECGYRSAVTTSEGANPAGSDRFRLRRLSVCDEWSMADFAFNVSRMFIEGSAEMETIPQAGTRAATDSLQHGVPR